MVPACHPFGQTEEIMVCVMCCSFVFNLLLSQCKQILLPTSSLCSRLIDCRLSSFGRNNTFFKFIAGTVFFVNITCHCLNPCLAFSSNIFIYTFPFTAHINLFLSIFKKSGKMITASSWWHILILLCKQTYWDPDVIPQIQDRIRQV